MSRFSVGNFLSRSAKKLVGEPFCAAFQNYSASEKVYGSEVRMEGVSRFSVEVFFNSECQKIGRGTLVCCVSEIFR